ncbi:fibronectin type III domain-containing protein [Acanthopleuribacter pedis]|uniref:FecR protein domain-containing protein n=1 Tax=Acanthopleuribacter pedis TaxID=442870 RepID=A0A8J7Q7E0_9BACT|nr:fibronectin type III domain-containing protein [Acanthopleuribacter pedis]MBO1322042.1 hypothetical protein [Acanthopleuribacter pedis]
MKATKINISSTEIKKWAVFGIVLVGLVLVYLVMFNPKGEREAREMVQRAQNTLQEARVAVRTQGNNTPNVSMEEAAKALEKAQSLLIESDYTAAQREAQRANRYAQSVLEQYDPKQTLKAKVTISDFVGNVAVRKNNQNTFVAANRNTVLEIGDRIRTQAGGACRVVFMEGMRILMDPNSLIKIDESFRGAKEKSLLSLYADGGQLEISTSDLGQGRRATISTEFTQSLVYSNSELLHQVENDVTTILVRTGRVEVQTGSTSVNLVKNQGLIIRRDQPGDAVLALLPSPSPNSPGNFDTYKANANNFVKVTFTWDAVPGANAYHLEVSRDPYLLNLIEEREGFPGQRVILPNLQPGTYYWRITSQSNSGKIGVPSLIREFTVNEGTQRREVANVDNAPPSLQVTKVSVQGYLVIVQGKTERDALVRVNDEKALVDDRTGDFSHATTLPGRGIYTINVVSEDRAGNRSYKPQKIQINE